MHTVSALSKTNFILVKLNSYVNGKVQRKLPIPVRRESAAARLLARIADPNPAEGKDVFSRECCVVR